MAKPLLLIDGNSLAHAAFHAKELGNSSGQGSQVSFTVLNALRSFLASEFTGHTPLVLWDSRSKYRKEIYPDYKGNRSSTLDSPEKAIQRADFKQQSAYLQRALKSLGVTQAIAEGFEADDLAYQLIKNAKQPVIMVTGDRDWLQMVRPDVCWFQHRVDQRRMVGFAGFENETGVKSSASFVEVKALMGDASDNIPGVGGIGEKGAKDLINKHESVHQFLDWARTSNAKLPEALSRLVTNQPFEYRGKQYPPAMETFERNLKLVDLSRCPAIPRQTIQMTYARPNLEEFRAIAHELAFKTMLEDLTGWAYPFTKLHEEKKAA